MIPSCRGQEKVLRFYREHVESSFYDEKSTRYFLSRLSLDFRGNKKEKKRKNEKGNVRNKNKNHFSNVIFFLHDFIFSEIQITIIIISI